MLPGFNQQRAILKFGGFLYACKKITNESSLKLAFKIPVVLRVTEWIS